MDALGIRGEILACQETLADTAAFCEHYAIAPDEACNAILVALKTTPRQYVVCLVRSDTKIDVNHKLAAEVGVKRMSFATAGETMELTGMRIGGVTVFALPPEIALLVDQAVMDRQEIIVGGGNRTSKIRLAPAELLRIPMRASPISRFPERGDSESRRRLRRKKDWSRLEGCSARNGVCTHGRHDEPRRPRRHFPFCDRRAAGSHGSGRLGVVGRKPALLAPIAEETSRGEASPLHFRASIPKVPKAPR
jgi:prolyl-tRNA editing enzyme YbaK/EbsC (Cys-tRNA(Pro) deacylase)